MIGSFVTITVFISINDDIYADRYRSIRDKNVAVSKKPDPVREPVHELVRQSPNQYANQSGLVKT